MENLPQYQTWTAETLLSWKGVGESLLCQVLTQSAPHCAAQVKTTQLFKLSKCERQPKLCCSSQNLVSSFNNNTSSHFNMTDRRPPPLILHVSVVLLSPRGGRFKWRRNESAYFTAPNLNRPWLIPHEYQICEAELMPQNISTRCDDVNIKHTESESWMWEDQWRAATTWSTADMMLLTVSNQI